jgi:drug/metabolite transporter (DMT)-like permease
MWSGWRRAIERAMSPGQLASYGYISLAWGLSFLVIVKAVAAFGEIGTTVLRCFTAAGALLLFARATGRRLVFGGGVFPYAVIGATTVAGQLLGLNFAAPRVGTAMSAIIVATIPLFSMAISRAVGFETLSAARLAGLALGVFGVVLLVGFPDAAPTPDFLIGCAVCVGACLCAASGNVFAATRMRGVGAFETTIGGCFAGGLICAPLLLLQPFPAVPRAVDFVWIVILGAAMSAATYALYFRLVAEIGPTRAVTVEFVVTAVAVLVGALWLGERLTLLQLAAAGAIALGCALVLGLFGRRAGASTTS